MSLGPCCRSKFLILSEGEGGCFFFEGSHYSQTISVCPRLTFVWVTGFDIVQLVVLFTLTYPKTMFYLLFIDTNIWLFLFTTDFFSYRPPPYLLKGHVFLRLKTSKKRESYYLIFKGEEFTPEVCYWWRGKGMRWETFWRWETIWTSNNHLEKVSHLIPFPLLLIIEKSTPRIVVGFTSSNRRCHYLV